MGKNGPRVVAYFAVCGLGPALQSNNGIRGFQGTSVMYQPALLDQFPASTSDSQPPLQLSTCVLPAGVGFYSAGPSAADELSHPRSYPIVLTDGDGSKIYVSCVAFRDPVDDDVAQAYRIPANSYVDKCICVVSHLPCFLVFREALEELYRLCFSPSGCSKPLWDIIAHMVSSVRLPTLGRSQVLFSVENFLLNIEAPPKDGLPHADMSFQPLIQCLDIDNVIRLFTAILLERRVLLRANKYSVLTMVAEAVCHLIYPIKWQHVYIPVLFCDGVEYIDAPTPYLMGLQSSVDTSQLSMDGVVDVNLDNNHISFAPEEIPPIPEPEMSQLRMDLLQLVHPNLFHLDRACSSFSTLHDSHMRRFSKPWSKQHDMELRKIFLKFFVSILNGYRDFVDHSHTSASVFNSQAFLKKRSRMTNAPPDPMVVDFLSSQGFLEFLERGYGSAQAGPNLVDKFQEALGTGHDLSLVLPENFGDLEIITVSESTSQHSASRARYCYDRFPSAVRTQEAEEKRKEILAAASASFDRPSRPALTSSPFLSPTSTVASAVDKMKSLNPMERAAERERMVLDIKVKLQGLWRRLLVLGSMDDPLSSFEYGTILALIESDAEGIGGSGFVECIREHINSGWHCKLSEEQFIAVKELIKTTVSRATSRNDMATVRDVLEISSQVYRKNSTNLSDYVQRHLGALPVWEEVRFWEGYFEIIMDKCSEKTGSYAALVADQLVVLARHLAGLGLPDAECWFIMESIAQKNNLGAKQLIKLRGFLAHTSLVEKMYWGPSPGRVQSALSSNQGLSQQYSQGRANENQQPTEAAGVGRSWVQSMFSRDRAVLAGRSRNRPESGILASNDALRNVQQPIGDSAGAGARKASTGVRVLRGHKAAVTSLHPGTRSEVGDAIGDHEDAGYFISGSADCTVRLWDPNFRGFELRTTFTGHTGPVRSISSDRLRVVSGSDDKRVLVWDKYGGQLLEELKGHDNKVSCVQMLSGERLLTAAYDGKVKMWDVRTDTCVATVGHSSSAVLCMDYDDSTGVLAAAGSDGVANIWDVRAGKQMHKLVGHTNWVRSLRLVGDTIVTGSNDWTARVWSVSRGVCDSVLCCHASGITCVEYSTSDHSIITGSIDGMVRIWERQEGSLRCVKSVVGVHGAAIISIKAGEKWMAIGAADNTLSLFQHIGHRQDSHGWQLYRTPQRSSAVLRCVTSDVERGRICSGARNGLLRLWEPLATT